MRNYPPKIHMNSVGMDFKFVFCMFLIFNQLPHISQGKSLLFCSTFFWGFWGLRFPRLTPLCIILLQVLGNSHQAGKVAHEKEWTEVLCTKKTICFLPNPWAGKKYRRQGFLKALMSQEGDVENDMPLRERQENSELWCQLNQWQRNLIQTNMEAVCL